MIVRSIALMLAAVLAATAAPAAPAARLPLAGGTDHAAADSAPVNRFMWYDAGARTVHVALFAALGSNNGGMNFNGGSGGSATITVPRGWKVRMRFTNTDAIPHSAIIVADQPPLPQIPQTPAFGAAYTRDLTGGLATGESDDMDFTAAAAGQYILVCGVPGHGASGMWIRFVVSADAKTPDYAM